MTGKNVGNGSVRWIVVGLSVHGLAAALLLANVLSSSAENGPGVEPRAPTPLEAPPLTPTTSRATRAPTAADATHSRELATGLAAALPATE